MNSESLRADFVELIEVHKKLIYKVGQMYCKNETDREDLLQDIVYNLWISFPKFEGRSKITTWIYRIALNTAITTFRDNVKRPLNVEYEPFITHLTDDYDDSLDELSSQLYTAINNLGKIDKAIMTLFLENYSYDEISEVVGLTKTNVATKISRIRLKLKKSMSTV
jgi:RNA polymerase sigma-70 factor (ECF subfamily)